jgi:hypothetical protein
VRAINADSLHMNIASYMAENAYLNDSPLDVLKMVAKWVEKAPTIDAVQVVRCGNCKYSDSLTYTKKNRWCRLGRKIVCNEDYCSDGERREAHELRKA